MGKEEKLTPLMIAAKTNNKEFVEILLQKNADPDVVVKVFNGEEDENYTALIYAIEAGSYQTLPQLYLVTNTELQMSFQKLADSDFEWEKDESCFQRLKTAIKAKIENDNNLFDDFFESAAISGNRTWLKFLRLEFPHLVKKLSEETRQRLLQHVVYSVHIHIYTLYLEICGITYFQVRREFLSYLNF